MDIVVYLALAVLAAVFLFSFFILIVMCHRKHEYNRLIMAHSLRFSKLHQDNFDDVVQLGPHISQKLNNNQWVEEVSGILQNCVAILKLCHILTDNLSKIPLNQSSPHLNELICQGTTRVVPRFDILLRSMAAKNVDIRVIESRVSALVTACWSLVTPFYLLSPKHKNMLGSIIEEMEIYHSQLLLALEQVEYESKPLKTTTTASTSGATSSNIATVQNANTSASLNSNENKILETEDANNKTTISMESKTKSTFSQTHSTSDITGELNTMPSLIDKRKMPKSILSNGNCINLRPVDESSKELLSDEAPADPSCA